MSVAEIIDEVKNLSSVERQQVLEALQAAETSQPTEDETRAAFHRHLMAEGLLKAVPPRLGKPPELRNFKPIPVEGKPVSETIIEERR